MGVSPASLSTHLTAVETELGTPLLIRNRRGVTLTPGGAALAREAGLAFEHLRIAGQLARRLNSSRPRATIGHCGASAIPILQHALPSLTDQRPEIDVHLHEAASQTQLDALRDGTIDLALIRPPAHRPDIDEEHLLDEPLVAVVPSNHLLAGSATLTLGDLEHQPVVLPPQSATPGAFEDHISTLRRHARTHEAVAEGTSITSLLILVAAGLGVTVLPAHAINDRSDGITAIPFASPDITLPLHLAWRRTDDDPFLFDIRRELLAAGRHLPPRSD